MSKTKLKLCERCEKCTYNPEVFKQCKLCFNRYMKPCNCKQNKYDSYLYKCCYECSRKEFAAKSKIINVDDLSLLSEDDEMT